MNNCHKIFKKINIFFKNIFNKKNYKIQKYVPKLDQTIIDTYIPIKDLSYQKI